MTDRRGGDDAAALTAAGHPEKRHAPERRRKSRRRDEKDREPMSRGEFRTWRNRAALLFLLLAGISCFAGYLGYHAGQDSQAGLVRNGREATFDTCVSGGELRVATAKMGDDLRSLALTSDVPPAVRLRFIERTQPAIDRLLSQAAGRRYVTPLPPGSVTEKVQRDVLRLSTLRCRARVAHTFGR